MHISVLSSFRVGLPLMACGVPDASAVAKANKVV